MWSYMLLKNINYLFLHYENICLLSDLSTSLPTVTSNLNTRLDVIRENHTHILWRNTGYLLVLLCGGVVFFCFVSLLLWDFSEQPTYKCMQSSLITRLYRNSSLSSINMPHFLITTEHFLWLLSLTSNMDSWLMCAPYGIWAPWGRLPTFISSVLAMAYEE